MNMDKTVFLILNITMLIALVLGILYVVSLFSQVSMCEQYMDTPLRDVPLKCANANR